MLRRGDRSQAGIKALTLVEDLYLQKLVAIKTPSNPTKPLLQFCNPVHREDASFCCGCYDGIFIPDGTADSCYYWLGSNSMDKFCRKNIKFRTKNLCQCTSIVSV